METAENLKELTLMIEAQDQVCGVCFPKKKRSRAGAEPPNPSTPPPARKQFIMGARWEEMPMEETRPLTFRILSRASVGSRGCSCLGGRWAMPDRQGLPRLQVFPPDSGFFPLFPLSHISVPCSSVDPERASLCMGS